MLKLHNYLLIALTGALFFTTCDDSSNNNDIDIDLNPIIENDASIIVKTYTSLDTEAGELLTAVQALQDGATEQNLQAAQQQWVETRAPWEQSESFLFGPVDTKGIDPSIDSWPLDKTDLDNVLAGNDELTKEYIDGLNKSLKGFHTIEYLLFGENSNKSISDFTEREFEYLIATTQSFKGETGNLITSWTGEENYYENFVQAGESNSIYISQKSALEELILGMENIANEVGTGKIYDPLSQQDPDLVESQFSFNSKVDFQNNMRSIKHIYTGDYNGETGAGVSDFVTEFDARLDTRFVAEIEAAIEAIAAIPGHFRDAIIENPDEVDSARAKVMAVLATIQQDIIPLLDEL